MNFFPLCTAMVCPMKSGTTVERRDQVRITFFSFFAFSTPTLSSKCPSLNGPFLRERPIVLRPYLFFALCVTIHFSVRLLLRVLKPRVGWPQGVTGLRPPEV